MSSIDPHVAKHFLEPLLAVFGQPSSDDPERFLTEYGRLLRAYTADELSRAADDLMQSHKGPARWPKLSECVTAAASQREQDKLAKAASQPAMPNFRERAAKAERAMMQSELGQEAARDGWANGLREHLMQKNRWPQEYEIHNMKSNAEFINRCACGMIEMGLMGKSLQVLAEKFVSRRNEIADRVLNGEVK